MVADSAASGSLPPHDRQGRTHRLELDDQSLREWDAVVLDVNDDGIVLDRSAFYPGGGGQPPDQGVLLWGGVTTRIAGARKADDVRLIPMEGDPVPPVGTSVRGALDDERRSWLMRTHSALHLLGGVVFRDLGALVTGGNMEPGMARMDFNLTEVPSGLKETLNGHSEAMWGPSRRTGRSSLRWDTSRPGCTQSGTRCARRQNLVRTGRSYSCVLTQG